MGLFQYIGVQTCFARGARLARPWRRSRSLAAQALVRVQETDSCPRRAASRLSEYNPRLGGHACAAQHKLRTALPSCPCCSHPSRAESGSSRPAVDPAATPQGLCSCHRRVPRAPFKHKWATGQPFERGIDVSTCLYLAVSFPRPQYQSENIGTQPPAAHRCSRRPG